MLLLVLVALLVWFLYLGSRKPRGFPPGPVRLPLVGYLPNMKSEHIYKQLWQMSSTYGNIIGLYFGSQATIIVNGWEAVKESILNDDLDGRPENIFSNIFFNDKQRGVMFVENDFWKEQRRFTLHKFRDLGFGKRSHEEVIQEEASELIKEIKETKGSISLQGMVGVSAINILWALMGGTRFSRKDGRLLHLVNILNELFRSGNVTGSIETVFPALHHIMPDSSSFNTAIRTFKPIKEFVKKSVEEHKADFDADNPRDFIDIYINELNKRKFEQDTTFTDDQLVAICTDVFSAGVDTGSSTVSFAILLSVLNPHVMRKMQQELDSVVGNVRLPSMNDRTKLVYTDATQTEVFRYRGSAPLTVPHKALRDTKLQGFRIPAGTVVMNNLYSVHMDPGYWGDPETFRPERFINPDGSFRKDERVIPFGKGRRSCLGESLARMTTFLLFSSLMQHFTFSLDPAIPVTNTDGKMGFTLAPPDFRVFAKARL
nr:methyl farnesoate epoxidase-like [Cherax quadricarinatus]